MDDPLRVYLHDHLAGSGFAIELLETLESRYAGHETGRIAKAVLEDVRQDRTTLEQIVASVGESHADLKDAASWFAEKASRMKLRHDDPVGIGAFEAFETLSLGILGKLGLWRVLAVIAEKDSRIAGNNFVNLIGRAQDQFARVEEYRIRLARNALKAQVS